MDGAVLTWKLYWCVLTERNWAVCGCHQETWLCTCCWSVSLSLGVDLTSLPVHYLLTRAAGEQEGSCRPGTVEADKSSLWMDLFPLDSVILIVVTCICFQFSRGRIQTPPYKARAFGCRDNAPPPPRGKKTCYGPAYLPQRKPATSQFLDDYKVISYNSVCSLKELTGLRYLGFVENSIRGKLI